MHTEIFARIDEKGAGLVRVFGVVLVTLVIVALAPGLVLAQEQADDRQYETEARAALEEYFLAWNAADNDAVAAISNFPRLTLGQNGLVVVRASAEEIFVDFEVLRQSGWDHSTLDLAEAVHVSPEKVHFRVVYTRYAADGRPYITTPGLYVMTRQDGHWGLQLQSVLPPTFTRP